jgi:small conductance mechanosensitive channel
MDQFWETLKNAAIDFINNGGVKIITALAVLCVGILLILIIKRIVKKKSVTSRKLDNSAISFITGVVSLVVYVGLFVAIIAILGFSTEGIITAFGSVALAISLGLQNTLSSLTNGIVLIFTKPFVAGDFVEIDGVSGTIKEIKLFSVKLVTTENITIVIPNSTVLNSTLINYSKLPSRRIEIIVPVSYDADIEQVKKCLLSLVENDERIHQDPKPFCRLTEYGDSSLNFTLRCWTNSSDFWNVKFDLLENIINAFRKNNIEIPYNQLEVFVKTNKENKEAK